MNDNIKELYSVDFFSIIRDKNPIQNEFSINIHQEIGVIHFENLNFIDFIYFNNIEVAENILFNNCTF